MESLFQFIKLNTGNVSNEFFAFFISSTDLIILVFNFDQWFMNGNRYFTHPFGIYICYLIFSTIHTCFFRSAIEPWEHIWLFRCAFLLCLLRRRHLEMKFTEICWFVKLVIKSARARESPKKYRKHIREKFNFRLRKWYFFRKVEDF